MNDTSPQLLTCCAHDNTHVLITMSLSMYACTTSTLESNTDHYHVYIRMQQQILNTSHDLQEQVTNP